MADIKKHSLITVWAESSACLSPQVGPGDGSRAVWGGCKGLPRDGWCVKVDFPQQRCGKGKQTEREMRPRKRAKHMEFSSHPNKVRKSNSQRN